MNIRLPLLAPLGAKFGVLALAGAAFGLLFTLSGELRAQPLPPDAPPSVFVATAQPVYYEGHASYWYGNHWYWRDVHGWHSYANEPGYLRDRRGHAPPPRYHYERRR